MAQSPNILNYTLLQHPPSVDSPFVVLRNSDDYHPERIDLHAGHVYTNALNNLFTAGFKSVLPDWDMFQSANPYGGFHAAARALNNGPIYLADEPDKHDADVIRPLVVGTAREDSRVLRPLLPALPTVKSIFSDARDVRTLLKICNSNAVGGNAGGIDGTSWVVGCFNCMTEFLTDSVTVHELQQTLRWRLQDVHSTFDDAVEHYAVYAFGNRQVAKVDLDTNISVFLRPASFQLLTMTPVRRIMYRDALERGKRGELQGVDVACIGLVDKYNGTVVISAVDVLPKAGSEDPWGYSVTLWARGLLGFYIQGVESVDLGSVVVEVNGEKVEPAWQDQLMVVDTRIDGKEVLQDVQVQILCK